MALIVQLNTRITSPSAGVIQDDNASYYDPTTGVNLHRGNPQSGDLSAFSSSQLANIANAVDFGVLSLVAGSLPAPTESFSLYSSYSMKATPNAGVMAATGGAGRDYHYGITGVAAADALENNF